MIENTDIKESVKYCIEHSIYLRKKLDEINYPYFYNSFSITTFMATPPDYLVEKWQLAKENDIAHVITMPSVNKDMIDNFINDLKNIQYI
jgi:histidine decarboxylase